ncbi:hypothetical protein N431DRAFT_438921 [Stipitochalara longipes BDJ]|nr:hypothetical protein N431DRAFT_438921 [Stipitochalara longipes BDJ]
MVRTNKGPRYPPPPLHPALHSDIPAMVTLWTRANAPDLLYGILAPPNSSTREHRASFLSSMISGSNTAVMKAVDWKDEKIITAFGVWGKMNYPGQEEDTGDELLGGIKLSGKESRGPLIGGMWINSKDEKRTPLEEYIAAQQEVIEKTWTKGVKHIELMVLMTDPAFQRRGIGSALLKWGHALAERENVPSFLGASPFGYPLYMSLGWNVVAGVVLDLKEWVGAGDEDMGWGVYKSRFMLRLPRVEDV